MVSLLTKLVHRIKFFVLNTLKGKSPHNVWITWKATFTFGNNRCNYHKKSTNHNLSVMSKPFSVNDYIFWSFLRCNTLEVIFWNRICTKKQEICLQYFLPSRQFHVVPVAPTQEMDWRFIQYWECRLPLRELSCVYWIFSNLVQANATFSCNC